MLTGIDYLGNAHTVTANDETDDVWASVASAATTDIGAINSRNILITGTTTITSLGTAPAGRTRTLRFSGILVMTYNATSLIMEGGANITTAANDTVTAVSLGSGNWILFGYARSSGQSLYSSLPPSTVIAYAGSAAPSGFLMCDGSAVSRTTYAALFTAIGTTYGAGDGSTTFNLPNANTGRTIVGTGTPVTTETVAASAVNTGTDTITIAANSHKWINGQIVQLTTTGTLPAPLAAATNYWITVSTNTIKLSSSLSNYVGGIFIDITTQGTGNHTLTWTGEARTLGETGGQEWKQQNVVEVANHQHSLGPTNSFGGTTTNNITFNGSGSNATGSTGGSQAFNIMQPYLVMNYIIKT